MTVTDPPVPFYADQAVTIWHGNALALPIPDASVDLVVTSPPYFGLRSYTDGGEHYAGQIGAEATPGEFVDALIAATAEMVRVLKPSGSIWVNLGDRYSGGTSGDRNNGFNERSGNAPGWRAQEQSQTKVGAVAGMRPKSLIGIPWRYAIRCIDELGLILRAEVIWSKPNGLPESVTDRVRRSHETWFHFTREPRYFSAVDEIREDHQATRQGRSTEGWRPGPPGQNRGTEVGRTHADGEPLRYFALSALGKLPGSVWEIPTQPLTVPAHLGIDHFAAFPMEWPRRIIRGWSPAGICVECGEGRRPVVVETGRMIPSNGKRVLGGTGPNAYGAGSGRGDGSTELIRTATGYSMPKREMMSAGYACACAAPTAPTRPSVVLDPFGGTGTTALVAKALGRIGWHVDLSADYCRLAQWRVTDSGEMARAMQVEKPPPAPKDMDSLLDLIEDGAA